MLLHGSTSTHILQWTVAAAMASLTIDMRTHHRGGSTLTEIQWDKAGVALPASALMASTKMVRLNRNGDLEKICYIQ